MIDVLMPASGNPFVDLVFTGLPRVPIAGEEIVADGLDILVGGSLTAGVVLTRLGLKVMYEAHLGRDFASRFILERMEAEGMSTAAVTIHDDLRACVTVAFTQHGDRSFISFAPLTPPPDPDLIDRHRPRAVMLDGLRVGPEVVETLRRTRRIGAVSLADTQDTAPTLADPGLREVFAHLDVLTLNEREVRNLTGVADLDEGLATLVAAGPVLALKQGAAGSTGVWRGGRHRVSALPVKSVVDTTGCGDNYFAALGAALLAGCPISKALAWGNVAGSLATQAAGGTGRRYDAAELTSLVAAHFPNLTACDGEPVITPAAHG